MLSREDVSLTPQPTAQPDGGSRSGRGEGACLRRERDCLGPGRLPSQDEQPDGRLPFHADHAEHAIHPECRDSTHSFIIFGDQPSLTTFCLESALLVIRRRVQAGRGRQGQARCSQREAQGPTRGQGTSSSARNFLIIFRSPSWDSLGLPVDHSRANLARRRAFPSAQPSRDGEFLIQTTVRLSSELKPLSLDRLRPASQPRQLERIRRRAVAPSQSSLYAFLTLPTCALSLSCPLFPR